MARVEISFSGQSRGAVEAAKQTANALKDVRKQAAESSVHLGHHSKALKEGEREMSRFTRGTLAGSGALSHFGRSIAFASSAFLGAAGLTAVVKSSISAGSDLEKQLERTTKVFGAQAAGIKSWSKESATSLGLARSEALDAASSIGTLLKNMGIAPTQAAGMSTSITKLASDMAAFKGVKPEVALAALEAGLQGRTRSLKTFGIVLDQTTIKQEAERQGLVKSTVDLGKVRTAELQLAIAQQHLNDAIAKHGPRSVEAAQATVALHKAEDALAKARAGHAEAITNEQKALATYSLLMKQTADQQGTFAKRSHDLAGQQQILRAQIKNLREELGQALLPVLEKYLPLVTSWIAKNEKNGTFQRDFNKAVKLGTELVQGVIPVVKAAVAVWNGFAKAVGGSRHAVELLTAAFVAYKGVTAALGFKALLTNIGLIGSEAVAAEGEVTGLRAALLALGGGAVLTALAAAGTAVVALGVPAAAFVQNANTQTFDTSAGTVYKSQDGKWRLRPTGSRAKPQVISEKRASQLVGHDVSTPVAANASAAAGGAGAEAGAKAAHGTAAATAAAKSEAAGVQWSGDHGGLDASFKSKLGTCVAAAGGSAIYVTSGRRSAAHNAAVGGASNSNHLTGHAADGTCAIGGTSYPLGNAPIAYGKYGLRAGSTFNWGGGPDIYHVDDGTNVGGAGTSTSTATTTPTTTFTEKPKPPKRVPVTAGLSLLSADTRVAIAHAATPAARRSALVEAREELEKLQKTASKKERVPIAEELGRINKQIQAIDVAAHRAKVAAIARQTQQMTARVKAAIAAQKTAWQQHVRDLQQIAADAKTRFEDRWSQMATRTMDAFDKATSKGLQKFQDAFTATMDAFDAETQRGLAALGAPAQTPEEQALEAFKAQRAAGEHAQKLSDLQQALTDAQAGGDPAAIKAAQDAIAQQSLDDQEAALQAQADASRKAADQKAQDDQTAYQAERDALRAHMQDVEGITETGYADAREKMKGELDGWLEDQKGKFETGKGDWKTFFGELVMLSDKYGIDAGAAFQGGWISVGPLAAAAAGGSAAAAAAAAAGPALGAAGFGGFDASGNWVGGNINTIDMSGVPGFATGGVVGSPRPRTMDPRDTLLVRARRGETLRTPEQEAALQAGGGGDVHVHFHGDVYDTRRAAEDAMARLAQPGLSRLGPTIRMGR